MRWVLLDQFAEEEMDAELPGSAKSTQCSLHGLDLETILGDDGPHLPESRGLRACTKEYCQRQRIIAKERERRKECRKII